MKPIDILLFLVLMALFVAAVAFLFKRKGKCAYCSKKENCPVTKIRSIRK